MAAETAKFDSGFYFNGCNDEYDVLQLQFKTKHFDEKIIKRKYQKEKNETIVKQEYRKEKNETIVKQEYQNEKNETIIKQEYQKEKNETIIKQEYQNEKNETTSELDETIGSHDLPEGWEIINHDSGMPIYMNTETRVCSFSKPYYIGINSLKKHEIPIASIPCLNQKLNNEKDTASTSTHQHINKCPKTLSHEEYQNYCSKVFKFRNIKFYKFNSWVKRRQYIRKQKDNLKINDLQKPTIISTTSDSVVKSKHNEFFSFEDLHHLIDLKGKSYIGILHEYIQRVLRASSHSFEVKELEQSKYPYLSTVIIEGMQYGTSTGATKKQAKLDSARATLQILLPSIKHFQTDDSNQGKNVIEDNDLEQYKIFDNIKITDSRIPQICAQSTKSTPYEMLKLCIKRNFGEDSNLLCEMEQMQSGSHTDNYYRCTMTVNKYSAAVICKNKLDGRQKGAQALLKILHPHIHYFGSLLRLYNDQHFEYIENKPIRPKIKTKNFKSHPDVNLLKKLRTTMLELAKQTNNN